MKRSFIYMRNKSGPIMQPCGIPQVILQYMLLMFLPSDTLFFKILLSSVIHYYYFEEYGKNCYKFIVSYLFNVQTLKTG